MTRWIVPVHRLGRRPKVSVRMWQVVVWSAVAGVYLAVAVALFVAGASR